jgi:hypothetical protein
MRGLAANAKNLEHARTETGAATVVLTLEAVGPSADGETLCLRPLSGAEGDIQVHIPQLNANLNNKYLAI